MGKAWIEETENLIGNIEQEVKVLAQEQDKLTRELSAKGEELAHWKAILQSYRDRRELGVPQPNIFLQKAGTYKELPHREILLLVRDQNEGNIPMKQVTELFKGKVTNPVHAAASAYSTLRRLVKQGKVTKVRPGLYRWVNGAS